MSSPKKANFSMCKETPVQTRSSNTDLSSFAASFVDHILDKIVIKSPNIQSSSELGLNTIDQSSEDSLDDKICQVSDENSSDAESANSYEEMDRCLKYDFPFALNSDNHRHKPIFRSASLQNVPVLDDDLSAYNPIRSQKFSFVKNRKESIPGHLDNNQIHQHHFILLGGHIKRKQVGVAPSFLRSHSESSYLHEVFYARPNSILRTELDSRTFESDRNKFLLEVENLCKKKETDIHHRILKNIAENVFNTNIKDCMTSPENSEQQYIENISAFLWKELKEHYRMLKRTAASAYQIGYETATSNAKTLIDELRTKDFMLDYFRREHHRTTECLIEKEREWSKMKNRLYSEISKSRKEMVSSINKQMHAGREGMVRVPSKRLHFLIDKFYNEEKMFSVVMEKEQKINELKLLLYQQQIANRELQEKFLHSCYNPVTYDTISQSTMRENFIRGMNRATISDYLDINTCCAAPYISQICEENFLDGFSIGDVYQTLYHSSIRENLCFFFSPTSK